MPGRPLAQEEERLLKGAAPPHVLICVGLQRQGYVKWEIPGGACLKASIFDIFQNKNEIAH
jgi:hypothetical protein